MEVRKKKSKVDENHFYVPDPILLSKPFSDDPKTWLKKPLT